MCVFWFLALFSLTFHASLPGCCALRERARAARHQRQPAHEPVHIGLPAVVSEGAALIEAKLAVAVPAPAALERKGRYWKFWLFASLTYLAAVCVVWIACRMMEYQKVQATRARRSTRSFIDFDAGLRFKQPQVEDAWTKIHERRVLKMGLKVMCFMCLCAIVYIGLREAETPKCVQKSREHRKLGVTLLVVQVAIAILALAAGTFAFFSEEIPPRTYFVAFAIFSFLLPAMNVPPFSVTEFRFQTACAQEIMSKKDPMVNALVDYSDFSLWGISSTMLQMSYLLILPWIVPRFSMMVLAIVWLVGTYISWGFLYFSYFAVPPNDDLADLRRPRDIVARTLFLILVWFVSAGRKWYLEKSERNRFISGLREFHATKQIYTILAVMVPEHVILRMLKGDTIADHVDCVSILFSEIQDFSRIATTKTPKALLEFLNNIFDEFDTICSHHGVTKIETWSHEYVACVGTMPVDVEESATYGHQLLLERLLSAGADMLKLQSYYEVEFRMGVNTGPIVAGVIGEKLPRYRLFGDTINTAARQMQRSLPGKLQFGQETADHLKGSCIGFHYRGEVEMKGKGKVKAYILDDNPTSQKMGKTKTGPSAQEGLAGRLMKQGVDRENTSTKNMTDKEGSDAFTEDEPLTFNDALDDYNEILGHEAADVDIAAVHLKGIINAIMVKGENAKRRFFLSQRAGFTSDMELAYKEDYHANAFCKKIIPRMGRQALLVSLLTVAECAYTMVMLDCLRLDPDLGRHLSLYSCYRGGAVMILLIWWYIASAYKWIERHRLFSQTAILLSNGLTIAFMWISYENFSTMQNSAGDQFRITNGEDRVKYMDLLSFDQVFSLISMLVVFLLSRSHRFLFLPGALFPLLCLGLVVHEACQPVHQMLPFRGKGLFIFNAIVTWVLAHDSEQESRARFKANMARDSTQDRTKKILETLMPPLVLQQVRELADADKMAHTYRHATLVQSDLCGFTSLASSKTPTEVVTLVQDLFGRFDRCATQRDIYKIETVGDAYIAGMAGEPLTIRNSPVDVVLFGLDMIDQVQEWSQSIGANVSVRVGIHHGECIAGIVGNDMQRYHIFGEMMDYIEVLESTGLEARIQVSTACKLEVQRQMTTDQITCGIEDFVPRAGDHLTTSKGEIHTFDKVGGRTYWVKFVGRSLAE